MLIQGLHITVCKWGVSFSKFDVIMINICYCLDFGAC